MIDLQIGARAAPPPRERIVKTAAASEDGRMIWHLRARSICCTQFWNAQICNLNSLFCLLSLLSDRDILTIDASRTDNGLHQEFTDTGRNRPRIFRRRFTICSSARDFSPTGNFFVCEIVDECGSTMGFGRVRSQLRDLSPAPGLIWSQIEGQRDRTIAIGENFLGLLNFQT